MSAASHQSHPDDPSEPSYIGLTATIDPSRHPSWTLKMVEYSIELAVVTMDFQQIQLDILDLFYNLAVPYMDEDEPEVIIRRKFIVTHCEQALCHAVYGYRDKVSQFVNAFLGAGQAERALANTLYEWLKVQDEQPILDVLNSFQQDDVLRGLIERRNAVTHRLTPHDVKALRGGRRLLEWASWQPGQDRLLNGRVRPHELEPGPCTPSPSA